MMGISDVAGRAVSAWVIFTDLEGFSKLNEEQLSIYYRCILPKLAAALEDYLPAQEGAKDSQGNPHVLVWNTWGDALVAVVDDATTTVDLMLEYRDFFLQLNFDKFGLPSLRAKISGHYGELDVFPDPLMQGRNNAIGHQVNTAARLEPVTMPNDIYVTTEFRNALEEHQIAALKVSFEDAGNVPLAKDFGSHNVYRMSRANEQNKIIYRILKQDLRQMLPRPSKLTSAEHEELAQADHWSDNALLKRCTAGLVSGEFRQDSTDTFVFDFASKLKDRGLYEAALQLIDVLENQKMTQVDGLNMRLCQLQPEVIKLKVNCLTRLGQYEPAANGIYGLYSSGAKNVDVLSMLAAQYKRRAIYGEQQDLPNQKLRPAVLENINQEWLHRALCLYIEAWRLDMENIYPAINVMYMYRFSNGTQRTRAMSLAQYIQQHWSVFQAPDWWTASSILETNLLVDLEGLADKFAETIARFAPEQFARDTTRQQIEMYCEITGEDCQETQKVIQLLS